MTCHTLGDTVVKEINTIYTKWNFSLVKKQIFQGKNTEWGKSKVTVVRVENNTIINNHKRMNSQW